MMGYLLLFKYLDLDYTVSTYAAEGGTWAGSSPTRSAGEAKMYEEAKRLGVKWILGGECGHMWRVCNQYQNTFYGESPSFLEVPKSPITGTVTVEHAKVHKMVHIFEFTADIIHNNKLKFDVSRNEHIKLTVTTTPAIPPGPWASLKSPATSLKMSCLEEVTSSRCRPTPSVERRSAAAPAPP